MMTRILPTPPFLGLSNVNVTPNIGSRIHWSVPRQTSCAVENLTGVMAAKKPSP